MDLLTVVPIFLLLIIIQNQVVGAKKRITKYPRYDCACGEINNKILDKIVGGKNTKPHAYPWQALVIFSEGKDSFMGGGTVINHFYILTAGHIGHGIPEKNITISLGVHDKYNNKTIKYYKVKERIEHELYNRIENIELHDIALLKVDRRIMFTDFVKPICLPNKNENIERKKATAIGWGNTKWNEKKLPTILQETQLEMLTRKECQKMFPLFDDTMICTSGYKHSIGRGDSGGPLFYTNQHGIAVQIGITSFIHEKSDFDFPAYFVSVTYFVDWIRKHTKPTQYCYKKL